MQSPLSIGSVHVPRTWLCKNRTAAACATAASSLICPCIAVRCSRTQERDRARRQKGKLQALELNGLVDFTDGHAKCAGLHAPTSSIAQLNMGSRPGREWRLSPCMLRRFVVLGSTGKHYTITLAASPACECMDFRYDAIANRAASTALEMHADHVSSFRLRRRICKHIRLVLVELGIEEDPSAWHQVLNGRMLPLFTSCFCISTSASRVATGCR